MWLGALLANVFGGGYIRLQVCDGFAKGAEPDAYKELKGAQKGEWVMAERVQNWFLYGCAEAKCRQEKPQDKRYKGKTYANPGMELARHIEDVLPVEDENELQQLWDDVDKLPTKAAQRKFLLTYFDKHLPLYMERIPASCRQSFISGFMWMATGDCAYFS